MFSNLVKVLRTAAIATVVSALPSYAALVTYSTAGNADPNVPTSFSFAGSGGFAGCVGSGTLTITCTITAGNTATLAFTPESSNTVDVSPQSNLPLGILNITSVGTFGPTALPTINVVFGINQTIPTPVGFVSLSGSSITGFVSSNTGNTGFTGQMTSGTGSGTVASVPAVFYDFRGVGSSTQLNPDANTINATASLTSPAPEPASFALLGGGLIGLALAARRRSAQKQ